MQYFYGIDGVIGCTYNGIQYAYRKNMQGDVIALVDSNGVVVVEYIYDAWGNHVVVDASGNEITSATHIGNLNPFRYRGYFYDVETGLYYLKSRYYDPETGRFINIDSITYAAPSEINGLNLYAYCMNNPIIFVDPSGHWLETLFDLFSLGVSIVEVVINPYDPLNWAGLAGDALDLLPFVTGVGETIRGVKIVAKGVDLADDTYDTIRIMKAVDFTDDALDTIRGLDRVGDFTQSTISAGRKIHAGYKTFDIVGKEFSKFRGIRLDYFDEVGKLVYELKPYNKNSLKAGVSQLARYRRRIGKGYAWILELY